LRRGFACSFFVGIDAQDLVSLAGGWKGAGFVTAEETVAEADDEGVAKFAQGARDEGECSA